MTELDYGRIFSTLSVKIRTTILRMLTVSIATGTSNDSCSDELTLPIRDWLLLYESPYWALHFFAIQNYMSDTSWVFNRL